MPIPTKKGKCTLTIQNNYDNSGVLILAVPNSPGPGTHTELYPYTPGTTQYNNLNFDGSTAIGYNNSDTGTGSISVDIQ